MVICRLQEDSQIMSFTLSENSQLALLNIATQVDNLACLFFEFVLITVESFIIPAKARDYVFTGVGLSVCLSLCLLPR